MKKLIVKRSRQMENILGVSYYNYYIQWDGIDSQSHRYQMSSEGWESMKSNLEMAFNYDIQYSEY